MVEPQPEAPFNRGPFLSAAFLCEKVLREQDGVSSAIRIIDRVNRQATGQEAPDTMEPFAYEINLYLAFKSGAARGPLPLEIRLDKPSGDSSEPFRQTLNFEGDDERGVNVITLLQMQIDLPGLYWFDVHLDGHRVTKIPMRVVYDPQVMQTNASPG